MLLAVVGATGVGKSEFALDAAEALAARGIRSEIVNADAMQLYRGMDIGTAKLSMAERRGVRHHLLDVLDVTEEAAVAAYQRDASAVIDLLEADGVWPILVGGSGLYVSAVLFGFDFPERDPEVRSALTAELEREGTEHMLERLRELDPDAANEVDPANGRRIVRALEAVTVTGRPWKASLPNSVPVRPTRIAHLRTDRAELVERLDARVTRFWRDGLLDEVEQLRQHGLEEGVTARQAIGYEQALRQLRGELTEHDAQEQTRIATRRLSRRQVSWFKRYAADEPALAEAGEWASAIAAG